MFFSPKPIVQAAIWDCSIPVYTSPAWQRLEPEKSRIFAMWLQLQDLSDGSDAAAGGDGRTGPESEGSSAGGGGTAVGGDGTPAPEEGSSGSTRDSEPSSSPEGDDTGGGSGGSTGSGTGSGTPPTGSSALSSAASSLMPLVAAAASSLSLLAL